MQFRSCKRELPAQPVVAELSALAEILIVLASFFNIVTVSKEMVKSGWYVVKICTCKKGEKKWCDLKTKRTCTLELLFQPQSFHPLGSLHALDLDKIIGNYL